MGKVYIYSLCVYLCVNIVYGQFGFFPQRTDRRISSPYAQNLFLNPNGFRKIINNVLHLQPENPSSNPAYIYPFVNAQNRPISNNNQFYQNRPINNGQFDQNRPISNGQFDQNRPISNGQFDQYRPINNGQFDQNRPIDNDQVDQSRPINNDQLDQNRPINNEQLDQNRPINNEFDQSRPYYDNENNRRNNFRFPNQGNIPNGNVNFGQQQTTGPFVNLNPEIVEKPNQQTGDQLNNGNGNDKPNAPDVNNDDKFENQPTLSPINNDEGVNANTGGDGQDNRHGIPDVPPPGFQASTLPPLTPVPASESRNNFGIFSDTCKTVDNGVGSCINVASCEPYMKLLQNARRSNDAVQLLRKVHCGFEGSNPKVCCPFQKIPDVPPPTLPPSTAAPAPITTSTESVVASGKSLPDSSDFIEKFPEPPVCGVSNGTFSRVVGGVDAKLGAFPWMALLGYKERSSTRWLCGGSLISTHHVLTAAHCIHKHETDLYVVRLGELDLAREDEGATPIDVLIKYKIKHEDYDRSTITNDIGLLILEQRVQFTDLIKPICIPQSSELRSNTFEDWTPLLAGWGDTEFRGPSANHLQVVQLPVVSNTFCANAYKPYKSQVIDERVLCAGYKKGGKDACQGDSGGPLMQPIYNPETLATYLYQIGVVSYGRNCAEAGFPGVYSRVTHFVPWLEKNVLVIMKAWFLLRKYILTIPRFDLFLQGALLIVVFLESYVYLLLRRNARSGYLPSINEDWLKLGVGGAEFLFGTIVAWWGRGSRHFALSGWLCATAVSGLIVLAFPYPASGRPSVALCGGGSISPYLEPVEDMERYDHLVPARTAVLIITAIFCSFTKISIWAHGITYLDDHEPASGPYFYGILISIRLSLGLSGQNWMRDVSVREDWWEAQLSLSMLTLMFSILFTLFPKRMEGYKEFYEVEYNCILKPIGRMLSNKALMIQTVALSLLNTALFGYVNYDTASIQAKFHVETLRQDPRTTRTIMDIFRSLVIIFFVSIFRMRFSVRRRDAVKSNTASKVGGACCVLVAVFFAVLTGLHCRTGEMAGFNGSYEQPDCSIDCGCISENYGFSPVCILNTSTTYFSPCHAGCKEYEDLNGFLLFENCNCGPHRALRGSCTLPDCWLTYNLYLVFFTLVLATTAASFLMQGMVALRAVRARDKPIAIGVTFALIGLLSHVLGHALYMVISHLTCAFEEKGVCLFHKFSVWSIGAVSAVLAVLSGVFSILASRYPPAPEMLVTSDMPVS
ncbi:unnamed protein product, partial [Brenthis ino]